MKSDTHISMSAFKVNKVSCQFVLYNFQLQTPSYPLAYPQTIPITHRPSLREATAIAS